MKAKFLLPIIFFFPCLSLSAQTMLKDVSQGGPGSYPMSFTRAGDYVYFVAQDNTHGFELWKTDGTETGTAMVKDINPVGNGCGEIDYLSFGVPRATPIFPAGNGMVFFANDYIHGYEPWSSDGTEAGTQMLLDIDSSSTSSVVSLHSLVVFPQAFLVNGKVIFRAYDKNQQNGVWITDGTTSGTHRLTDQNGNVVVPPAGDFDAIGVFGSVAYMNFSGQLWKTDGTPGGTELLSNSIYGHEDIVKAGGYLFMTSSDGLSGIELLSVDTLTYTPLIIDINTGLGHSYPHNMIVYNNELYFSANDIIHGREFWKSDGTFAGTQLVKDIHPGLSGSSQWETNPIVFNGSIIFIADDGTSTFLWKSDGTETGTVPITDPSLVEPYNEYQPGADKNLLIEVNGSIYFPGRNPATGIELWKINGDLTSVIMFNETCEGPCTNLSMTLTGGYGGYKSFLYFADPLIYFAANDSIYGEEPWVMNSSVGIGNVTQNESDFLIYPNPADNFFTLNSPVKRSNLSLNLFDLFGREVMRSDYINQSEINVERKNLPAGIYSVIVSGPHQEILYSGKVIFL